MADIYTRETNLVGAISADATTLSFAANGQSAFNVSSDAGATKLIIQDNTINYKQNVNRLYGLEDKSVYFVVGRTEGDMSCRHVVGPAALPKAFFSAYGDACKAKGNNFVITVNTGCGSTTNTAQKVTVANPVINSVQLQVGVENFTIFDTFSAIFTSLSIE